LVYPHCKTELECHASGHLYIAGLDEVGRGCLAGPVVAAAVIFSREQFSAGIPKGINDSKKLSAKQRERLNGLIRECAVAFAIGFAEAQEIDEINIFQASKLAMVRAVQLLNPQPHYLLVDGNFRIDHPLPQKCIIKGDQISVSIAAASILAKVYRDSLMATLDEKYPGYAFAKHKGYGSVEHRQSLQKNGPSPIHRRSFSWTAV
jgi:ribonuclease HII